MNAKDVKRIRAKLGLSQSQFSNLLGLSVRTLQQWEQGRQAPGAPAAALLKLADSGMLKDEPMNTEISKAQVMRKIQQTIREADRLVRTAELMAVKELNPDERKEFAKLRRSLLRSIRAVR